MAFRVLRLAAAASLVHAAERGPLPSFEEWEAEQGRRYATALLREQAREAFLANRAVIDGLSRDAGDGAVYGATRFSDLTPEDFRRRYLPATMDAAEGLRGGQPVSPGVSLEDVPAAIDWRTEGAVTPVKDQASCGSCWAESAVSNIESAWYLANRGTLFAPVVLSVEQVIECDAHDNACYGGFPRGAYQYVIEDGGLASAADYPYQVNGHTICLANQTFNASCGDGMCDDPPLTSSCDLTCSVGAHKRVAHISSWVALPSSEDQIAAYLAEHGPVSVGIDAQGGALGVLIPWLQFYKRGVANPGRCTSTINHGVLLVGFGEEGEGRFWILKNSWGTKWGEAGYFRLIRGLARCGIDSMATSAVVSGARASQALLV